MSAAALVIDIVYLFGIIRVVIGRLNVGGAQ